jgi:hypothetical protein
MEREDQEIVLPAKAATFKEQKERGAMQEDWVEGMAGATEKLNQINKLPRILTVTRKEKITSK